MKAEDKAAASSTKHGRAAAFAAVALFVVSAGAGLADAPPPVAPQPGAGVPNSGAPSAATLKTSEDDADRMTVPVMIDGKGPFLFIVDTGADHTVISRELAAALKLPAGPSVDLNDTAGVGVVGTASIDTLRVGPKTATHLTAPVLSRADIGADGMLGIDALRGQRVVLDFKAKRMSVEPSKGEHFSDDVVVVRGKRRFGELVLVDAEAKGEPVLVVLDSGAQNSVANAALRSRLARRNPQEVGYYSTVVISVTGHTTPAEYAEISEVRIGGITVRNMPLAFANLHTFDEFDLTHEPAMLLGMDVLRQFQRVSVDFGRNEVRFHLQDEDASFVRLNVDPTHLG